MGLGHSPIVVSEGLVFYFDPINTRSYAGTGLTGYNLINTAASGALVGGALYDTANKGSIYLDGVNDYINFTTQPISDNNSLSINCWVKFPVIPNAFNPIVDTGNVGVGSGGYCLSFNNTGKIYMAVNSGFTAINYNFATNTWYNITGTAQQGSPYSIKIYVNAIEASIGSSGASNSLTNINSNLRIGSNFVGAITYLNANIGSLSIYNRALSSTEILQNYNATKKRFSPEENIVTNGLVYYFDAGNTNSYAGTGLTAYDIAGSGATNSLVNGPAFSTLNGGSIYFDGLDDHIVNNSRTISSEFQYTSAFTIIAFCKIIENTNTGYIVNNRTTDGSGTLYTGWGFVQDQGTIVGFVGGYPGNTLSWRRAGISTTSFNNLVYNKWAQVAFVNTGVAAGQKIYINAIDYTSYATDDTNPPYTVNYAGAHRIYIGQDGTGAGVHPMTANIAQVQIYNRALSSTEILQNYNASKGRYGLS